MLTRNAVAFWMLPGFAWLAGACSSWETGTEPPADWLEQPNAVQPALDYEEYRADARAAAGELPGFVVERDMWFPAEESLIQYYEETFVLPRQKSIVNLTSGGERDWRGKPELRYCFCAGWGMNQGSYNAPSLDAVRTSIQAAMKEWEKAANVRFTYMSALDGATCTNSGANPGVDFVVQHWNNFNTAIGPFPSNPWSEQQLKVPVLGIDRLLAIHEVGHALGFRHEHVHPDASPRCTFGEGTSYEPLTGFDTLSCMKYFNCQASGAVNGTEISWFDSVGAKIGYGPPVWWVPAIY